MTVEGAVNGIANTVEHPARTAIQGTISTLLCPSDPSSSVPSLNNNNLARCNIMTCRGDFLSHTANIVQPNATDPWMTWDNAARAPFMMISHANNDAGIGTPNSKNFWRGFEGITDGTSNTMAASEAVSAESRDSKSVYGAVIRTNFVMSGGTRTDTSALSSPQICLDMLAPGDRTSYNVTGTTGTGSGTIADGIIRGNLFCDGRVTRAGFQCLLPPNSPSCVNNGDNSFTRAGVMSATSRHPGGVNAGLFDGSVRFVSQTIASGNASNTQAICGGMSTYGVWGAMATIGQGDSVSM